MAFSRPTLADIISRVRTDIQTRLSGSDAFLRRSVEGVLARVIAGVAHGLYGYISHTAAMIVASTAEGAHLDAWALLFGVPRAPATVSTGNCTFTGTNTTVIPSGTPIQIGDYLYTSTAAGTITAGSATIPVTSDETGYATQAEAGQTARLASPIAGVTTAGVVASGGITGGSDRETDAALKARLLDRIALRPKSGAVGDYEAWALECSGVTRAWEYHDWFGLGTVGVFFARDLDASPIPDAAEVANVQNYIDERASVVALPVVMAPIARALNPTISITPDTAAIRTAVQAELVDLMLTSAEPRGTLYLSNIDEAISRAAGEEGHVLSSPTADIVYAANELGVLGTISWV